MIGEIRSEVRDLRTGKKELHRFTVLLFLIFSIMGGMVLRKSIGHGIILLIIGTFFLLAGLIRPCFLKILYQVWMMLGFILGWIMTRLILSITFLFVFTPVGLLLRLLRKDLLDQKLEKTKASYWEKYKTITDRTRYMKKF